MKHYNSIVVVVRGKQETSNFGAEPSSCERLKRHEVSLAKLQCTELTLFLGWLCLCDTVLKGALGIRIKADVMVYTGAHECIEY